MINIKHVHMPKPLVKQVGCGDLVEWHGSGAQYNPCLVTWGCIVSLSYPGKTWSWEGKRDEDESPGVKEAQMLIEKGVMSALPQGTQVLLEIVQD